MTIAQKQKQEKINTSDKQLIISGKLPNQNLSKKQAIIEEMIENAKQIINSLGIINMIVLKKPKSMVLALTNLESLEKLMINVVTRNQRF